MFVNLFNWILVVVIQQLVVQVFVADLCYKQKCSTEIVQKSRKTKRSINNFVTKLRPVTGIGRSYVCVFYNIKHSTDYVYIYHIYLYIIERKKCVQLGKVEEEEGRNY